MNRYTNLLVAIDPDHEEQPALSRALDIARKSSADVKITLFLAIYDFSYEMTSMLSSEERQAMRTGVLRQREEWVASLVAQHDTESIDVTTHVVWHNRPYESMIAQVFDSKHDLLVKTTHEHDKLGSVIFTPTDWHLLRKCPCPVLLVKEHAWPEYGKILTAVNVSSENETHIPLNDKLIDEAKAMAKLLTAEVNLVNAYPATPVNVTIELPEFDPASYTDAVRGHHLLEMKALRQKHGIDESQTFCQEGLPEDVIPAVSKELDAELVILGTTGRVGLSAIFIGNTAEHTIDQLNCDVLAIKPDGYVSPLAPNLSEE
ncbi:universal stress protein UspE [Enterovibrio norvegicus FF-33]|uniref:Universal stress protein UspE n=1 Tax=Enterovibrio norvegicus FF-454 TaxID=1185651 RepID=A0A1E5C9H7_9GAMM|nr:universal stress protein UspE [Enterovibrio norvegicus]OEE62171.1 universal stress protein UspE [Enterovibrio norvegicus FF-454]OEE65757.1 universal stress protein UspE [Enterovibrio norvegicus FF-33]OEE82247.1 universal stress protein UspE [Enterovibrio norvegicus FF-162]